MAAFEADRAAAKAWTLQETEACAAEVEKLAAELRTSGFPDEAFAALRMAADAIRARKNQWA